MPTMSIARPSHTSASPKCRGASLLFRICASCAFWKTWKIVKPKGSSERDVRITDINVRSALKRVRWNDIPVRRDASSVEILASLDADVTRSLPCVSLPALLPVRLPRNTRLRATALPSIPPCDGLTRARCNESRDDKSTYRPAAPCERLGGRGGQSFGRHGTRL